jgi:hypothetical protein
MHNFRNGHLIVRGCPINEIDFSSFHDSSEMTRWGADCWASIEGAGEIKVMLSDGQISMVDTEDMASKKLTYSHIFGDEFVTFWHEASDRIQHEVRMATPVIVDEIAYPVIKCFALYHSGWESDEWAYVVNTGDTGAKLVLGNLGSYYFASGGELEAYIATYQKAIADAQDALATIQS